MSETAANDASKSIRVELDRDLAQALDAWRRQQDSIPSVAASVRHLLAIGLQSDRADHVAA
jgi:hypothetical protein